MTNNEPIRTVTLVEFYRSRRRAIGLSDPAARRAAIIRLHKLRVSLRGVSTGTEER